MKVELPYKKYIVYKEGHAFVLLVYKITNTFPTHEQYGITSQLRRAAISITANIVEGSGKESDKDFYRYLTIAKGSLVECSYHLELSRDLRYLTQEEYLRLETQRAKVGFLLHKFMLAIKKCFKS